MRELSEPSPHAVGVDEFVLGRFHRPVCTSMLNGHLARFEDFINAELLNRDTASTFQFSNTLSFTTFPQTKWPITKLSNTTWSSSARAVRGCVRPLKLQPPELRSG